MTKNTIASFLKEDNKSLGSLLRRLNQLKRWNTLLAQCLPPMSGLEKHVQIVNLKQQELIVLADTGAWMTQFRFNIPDILIKIKQLPEFAQVKTISCKVFPQYKGVNLHKKRPPQQMSSATTSILQQTANKIQSPELKDIIEKIARGKSKN